MKNKKNLMKIIKIYYIALFANFYIIKINYFMPYYILAILTNLKIILIKFKKKDNF